MRGTRRPAFLIIMDRDVTLRQLEGKVKTLCNTRVWWSRHTNNKVISQCHRCQQWGHATSNCGAPAKCLKCAGPHLTAECKPEIAAEEFKCANCSGNHCANSTDCPVYIKKIENLMTTAKPKNRFVQAPKPTNPWTNQQETHKQVVFNERDFPALRHPRKNSEKANHSSNPDNPQVAKFPTVTGNTLINTQNASENQNKNFNDFLK